MPIWVVAILAAGMISVPGQQVPDRQDSFREAALAYGVPESVLLAVSYLESRWDGNAGQPSVAGGYGPMHLIDPSALYDASALAARLTGPGEVQVPVGGHFLGDPRGDASRPMRITRAPAVQEEPSSAEEPTLRLAARLTGLPAERLREDPDANIRGGAALLADFQRQAGGTMSPDPALWYPAVARYAGSTGSFVREAFELIRQGVVRTTDDGSRVLLAPVPRLLVPALDAAPPVLAGPPVPAGSPGPADSGSPGPAKPAVKAECPDTLGCEWMPAAYKKFGKKDYGNHDRMSGPRRIDYILVHDTEGSYAGIPSMVSDPKYVSWHYTIRSSDGHVAQHVRTGDIAWHAGNWDVNSRSVGIEHEGYLAKGGTWYTEAMYRSSAALVKYLATRFRIPINRAHILGHDNVPGTTAAQVPGMHEDPGPYWDWAHYFRLMNAPIKGSPLTYEETASTGSSRANPAPAAASLADSTLVGTSRKDPAPDGRSLIIRPDYETNLQKFTGCGKKTPGCAPHGSASVWLRTAPSPDAPLIDDIGKRVDAPSTYSVYDHSARASTGQRYALAEISGEWTAIWYLGQKAWFHNPPSAPTAIIATGPVITPVRDNVPVYGRAYPEKSAYPAGVNFQPPSPLQYTLRLDQSYASDLTLPGTYQAAGSYNPARHVTVTGKLRYHQIQLGHRIMFVRAEDVRVLP